MKKGINSIIGTILLLTGILILFFNIRVYFSYRTLFSGFSGVYVVLLLVTIIINVIKPCKMAKIGLGIVFLLLLLGIIMSMRLSLYSLSFLEILAVILSIGIGTGLIIKDIIKKKE